MIRRVAIPSIRQLAVIGVALAGVLVVVSGSALLSVMLAESPQPPIGAISSPTVEGEVAGGIPSAPAPSPSGSILSQVRITFDELVMGAALPKGWRILGDPANAEVAPFPNAVDRSLQLTTMPSGSPITVCLPFERTATLVSVDLLADQPPGLALSLRDPSTGAEARVVVAADGRPTIRPGERPLDASAVPADTWMRAQFENLAAGTILAHLVPRGDELAAGASGPVGWSAIGPIFELCFTSPSAATSKLMVDNVVIE